MADLAPVYVTDTNALVWYLTDNQNLGSQARAVFEAALRGETQIVVSAIVLAELYYADKKRALFQNFHAVYQDLRSHPSFTLVSFTADEVADFDRLTAVPEMHDRIVVGLAQRLGVPLLASDPEILKAGVAEIVW